MYLIPIQVFSSRHLQLLLTTVILSTIVFSYFALPDSGLTGNQLRNSTDFLLNRLPIVLDKGAVWGSGKEFSEIDRDNMTIIIKLNSGSYVTILRG